MRDWMFMHYAENYCEDDYPEWGHCFGFESSFSVSLLHLGFHRQYCCIFLGYQARIFYFSFFSALHKSFEFYNLKSYWILTYSRLSISNDTSECQWIFHCFTWYIGVNNIQKYLNGTEKEETCFHASLYPTL